MATGNGYKTYRKTVRLPTLHREKILAEQVKQIYTLAPLGFLATFVNSLIVFFVMKDVMPTGLLVAWLAAVVTITVLRFFLILLFRKVDPKPAAAPTWGTRFIISLFIVGIAWGAIGTFPFSGISLAHQVFIAFVLGGMAAGASSTFSMIRIGYAAYSIPALLPVTVHFFLINDPFHHAMGIMILLFGLLLWRISQHNYSVNTTSLRLRFENLEIIQSLKEANERAEDLNAQLLEEVEARNKAEAALRAQHDSLERIVEERTSDLVKTNEQLNTAKVAAEAANIAKGEFVVNMSHEMRTPLAGSLGMINLVHLRWGSGMKKSGFCRWQNAPRNRCCGSSPMCWILPGWKLE